MYMLNRPRRVQLLGRAPARNFLLTAENTIRPTYAPKIRRFAVMRVVAAVKRPQALSVSRLV